MSAEVVRHALHVVRRALIAGMYEIIRAGRRLDLILYLFDDGGRHTLVSWKDCERSPHSREEISRQVVDTQAVAALCVTEFQASLEGDDGRAAALHWSYPADGICSSTFYVVEGPEVHEFPDGISDTRQDLATWLEEILELPEAA